MKDMVPGKNIYLSAKHLKIITAGLAVLEEEEGPWYMDQEEKEKLLKKLSKEWS